MIYLAHDEEQDAVAEMTRELGLEALWPVSRDSEAAAAVPAKIWKAVVVYVRERCSHTHRFLHGNAGRCRNVFKLAFAKVAPELVAANLIQKQ